MRRALFAAATLWVGLSGQAWAHMVDQAFKDVPKEHWAAEAIEDMAVKRSLMRAFPDDTFRGAKPLSRSQFAQSLMVLVDEFETLSKTSWRDGKATHFTLRDVKDNDPSRPLILTLVNDYRLWDSVPTVDHETFRPEETVTRSEVALVIKNLLAEGEARRAVLPRDPRDPKNPFKDLKPSEWAYQAILTNYQRYKVMVGFPDLNFKPQDELTRYQYASVGASTFEMIREVIRKTIEEKEALSERVRPNRFQERLPLTLSLAPGGALGTSVNTFNVGAGARYVAYPAKILGLDWFGLAEARVGINPGTSGTLTVGTFPQTPELELPGIGIIQLQPYVGLRGILDSTAGPGLGVPVLGGVAYWHSGQWGAYALGDVNPLSVPGTMGVVSSLALGAEYKMTPTFALNGGLGVATLPGYFQIAPSVGVGLGF